MLAEAAARYVGIARARTPDEMIEELASRIGRERGGEARAHALGGIRRKSELRHEQEAAASAGFAELGARLIEARGRYLEARDRDEALFGTEFAASAE